MEWWGGQGAQMSPNPVPGVNHCWLEPGLGQRGVCEHCGRVTGPGHRAQDHNNNNNSSGTLQTQPRRRVEPQYGKFSKTHEKSLKRWHGDLPSWQLFNSHSKDHRTLAPSCAISTINHVVISGRLNTAGPSWSLAKPANQSLAHVASVQTLKASSAVLCAMYCQSRRCTVTVPGQTRFSAPFQCHLMSPQMSESHSAFIYYVSLHCLIALDPDNGMHGWRSINSF